MVKYEKDPFEGMEEAKRPQIKFGKIGDWFKGTIVDNTREIENKLSAKHEMQLICEFKMFGGSFHNIENKVVMDEPTVLEQGEFYSYFAKGPVKVQLQRAKIGQIVGLRFTEERPNAQPGLNATKIIKVYLGEMDPDYQGEQAGDLS